jgi:hypothetical protein
MQDRFLHARLRLRPLHRTSRPLLAQSLPDLCVLLMHSLLLWLLLPFTVRRLCLLQAHAIPS